MFREYLDDGVYVEFDGFQLWLGLAPGQHLIALDPSVFDNLCQYVEKLQSELRERANATN